MNEYIEARITALAKEIMSYISNCVESKKFTDADAEYINHLLDALRVLIKNTPRQ